ncbi:MAG: hypothetical protein AB7G23_01525 [Vicinamibacterales bacterium]
MAAALLLGILLVLLSAPVTADIDVRHEATLVGDVTVTWLWGAVRVTRRVPAASGPTQGQAAVSGAAPPAQKPGTRRLSQAYTRRQGASSSRRGRSRAFAALRTPGLLARVCRLGRGLVRQVHWQSCRARLAFGCEDPAETGVLFGLLYPAVLSARGAGLDIAVEPRFEGRALALAWHGRVMLVPVRVVATITAFLCAPVVWQATARAWKAGR